MMGSAFVIAVASAFTAASAFSDPSRVKVGPGEVRLVYQPDADTTRIPVGAFWLDATPVTNAQFLEYVKHHPGWRRDRVKPLFADASYLADWAGPVTLGASTSPDAPVTRVSWFAARAFCRARGGRLPTEYEWELAAQAAAESPGAAKKIAAWYSQPTPKVLPKVGQGERSPHGVFDLYGLVWEWVDDFANTLVTGDSRESGDPDKLQFCGAGALRASNGMDYAAFMRAAFRSSLQGRFTTANLGFRCASEFKGTSK
jgi:formylglycine-generating enzyme required for sulfatase activity